MGFYLRDNPCKGCSDRHAGCHGTCTEYKEWREAYSNFKDEEAKERYMHNSITRMQKESKYKRSRNNDNNFRNKSKLYRIVNDNKIGD